MKRLVYISTLLIFLSCEEPVVVDLPQAQNQIVVEGWVSDSLDTHPIRITQSNAFDSPVPIVAIENAQVIVQSRDGDVFTYEYTSNGYYDATSSYSGMIGTEYRVRIVLDTVEIRSEWDEIPTNVPINDVEIASFQENDPNNSSQQITIFYPKVTARDPEGETNFYRWVFYKDEQVFKEAEPITVQDDRLFDGNLIPNNFQNFEYEEGDELSIELVSISERAYNYLSLLRSQITTLGTSSGTTPAVVAGNLFYLDNSSREVLGYFGAVSTSFASETVR